MAKRRRLTKTAVEEAIHETKTRQFVERVGATEKLADGRHEVTVILFDTFEDPRRSPAGKALIDHLEGSGWTVAHHHGRRYTRLTVAEPITTA